MMDKECESLKSFTLCWGWDQPLPGPHSLSSYPPENGLSGVKKTGQEWQPPEQQL